MFEILMFEIFHETLTNDVVSFEQPSPDVLVLFCDKTKAIFMQKDAFYIFSRKKTSVLL